MSTQEKSMNSVEVENNDVETQLPIRLTSKVVKGFGRGSTDLGIPTANLSRDLCRRNFDSLPCGIYWGFARIGTKPTTTDSPLGVVYKAAISIGYNPTYNNKEKTVEPHLIAPPQHPKRHASCCGETLLQEFYGETIRLSVVGYLRPELPFEGLEKLTSAIKDDIVHSEKLGDGQDENTRHEKAWVETDEDE